MERVNLIYQHPVFKECCEQIDKWEENRIFCSHNREHFLDVARVAMIINIEENFGIENYIIYGAALLHDIGRHLQYEKGIPHERASAEIALGILRDCGYGSKECERIVEAILFHRNNDIKDEKNLKGLLYRADKASRCCFWCKAKEECNWKDNKKNRRLMR